jgi:hypothetical protein
VFYFSVGYTVAGLAGMVVTEVTLVGLSLAGHGWLVPIGTSWPPRASGA